MMPQNVTSCGGTRRSARHHTSSSSHHGPRSTGWLNGVVRTGCQATATSPTDALHSSTLPHAANGMASPADGVKSGRTAAGVSINGVTGPVAGTINYKANQSCPKWHLKENRITKRRMKNPKPAMRCASVEPPKEEDWEREIQEAMSDGVLLELCAYRSAATCSDSSPPVASPMEEDWESEAQEVTSEKWEEMFGVDPYGPEDLPLFAVKDLTPTQEDSVIPVIGGFQPARDHPEPVQWLRVGASTEPDQFTDADH